MLKNLLWQREDEPQNMLAYLLLMQNIGYGITFAFFFNIDAVQRSAFNGEYSIIPVQLWGAACLVLALTTIACIIFRFRVLGSSVGFFGFLIWLYGFEVYFRTGMYFVAFSIYLVQMLFWVFWFIGVNRFYKREDAMVDLEPKEDETSR